jgi:hypothetical protein
MKTRDVSQERRQLELSQLKQIQQSGVATKTAKGGIQIKQPVTVKLNQNIVNNLNAGASKIRVDANTKTGTGAGQSNAGAGVANHSVIAATRAQR